MVHFCIVEDDDNYRNTLVDYLHQYEQEHNLNKAGQHFGEAPEQFKITLFKDGAEVIQDYTPVYDVILMDIELPELDGMSTSERIREIDKDVIIIFITNLSQYAIRGYQVEALDYVLKPISYYAFSQRIERALLRKGRRRKKVLSISTGKGNIMKIPVENLNYIETLGHSVIYHLTDQQITTYGTMKEIEKELEGEQFFRCNKGYLVNLDRVENIEGNMANVGGEQVQISRAKKKAFMDALNDYMSEVAK